jgi:hypothetical protein
MYVIHRNFDAAAKNQHGPIDLQELRVIGGNRGSERFIVLK